LRRTCGCAHFMAPPSSSQANTRGSPSQESLTTPKRSLRIRGANATTTINSPQVDGLGGDSDKDGSGGIGGGGKSLDFSPNDARGE